VRGTEVRSLHRLRPLALILVVSGLAIAAKEPVSPKRKAPVESQLVYTWEERVDGALIASEVRLYLSGFVTFSRRAGTSPPLDTTLPNDAEFVQEVLRLYQELKKARSVTAPCGAPQGGTLLVRAAQRTEKVDLSAPEQWQRYGRVVRFLLGRVLGEAVAPLESDCQPLRLRVDAARILERPAPSRRSPTRAEQELARLLDYGAARSEDARVQVLAELASAPGADRTFRWALLEQHRDSLPARRLLRLHLSELVRGVGSEAEAEALLTHLGKEQGAEADYHRAVLQLVLGRVDEGVASLEAFHQALNQTKAAAALPKRLGPARTALLDAMRLKPPYPRIRRAFPALVRFWYELGRGVWAGDPAGAPPLAHLLYRRALHAAHHAVLSPGPRAASGGVQTLRQVIDLIREYFPIWARGDGWELTFSEQQDLLAATGYARQHAARLGADWASQHLPDPGRTVCRMIRMRYLTAAEAFVQRLVTEKKADEGALRLAQGRCLAEVERWAEASRALGIAIRKGTAGALHRRVALLLAQGDLAGAERELKAAPASDPVARVLESQAHRLAGGPDAAIRAAQRAVTLRSEPRMQQALGQALVAAGQISQARLLYHQALQGSGAGLDRLRVELADLELASGNAREAMSVAAPLLQAAGPRARAAGHAVMTVAASRLAMTPLVRLELLRLRHHAGRDPVALADAAEILIRHGHGLTMALELTRLARALRPGWSRILALEATLRGKLRDLPAALEAITAALAIRPGFPPYRALERALVKLGA
jgi:tetratricopeptide (TPR) repeat protein